MDQETLWHDTIEDAFRALVDGLGGCNRVAHDLWPTKGIEDGRRHLLHCLDSTRPEKLSFGDIELLLKKGREADCHVALFYLADTANYTRPSPIEPEDEKAALQRQVLQMGAELKKALNRLDKIEPSFKAVS